MTYPIAAMMQPCRPAAVGLAEREFTDERPSHYRHRRARCRRCVFRGSEKCRSASPCADKDGCRYDDARRQWHDDPAYADVRRGGAQRLRPASPGASLAIEGESVQADLAVSRFVAVREWHDWPMRQSPVIVDECLFRAGSFADEMSCRFRDCNPGAERRLLHEAAKRRLSGPAKIAQRCAAAAGRVLDTRSAEPACEVGYLTSGIGSWRSPRKRINQAISIAYRRVRGKSHPLNLGTFREPAPNDRTAGRNESAPQRQQARTGRNTH
jgi:hypothetical protein